MKNRYAKMTQDDFSNIPEKIVSNLTTDEIMAIPGFYEVASEYFNNEVLELWEEEAIKAAKKRIQKKKADRLLYAGK